MTTNRTVGIFSYRGGTGKTTLISQLALYYSQILNKKTILIDMDLMIPGLHSTLGSPLVSHYINEIFLKKSDPKNILEMVTPFRENLDILLADKSSHAILETRKIEPRSYYTPFLVAFQILSTNYEVILIDTGPNMDHSTVVTYFVVKTPIIVTQLYRDDREGIKNRLEVWEKIASSFPHKFHEREDLVVINRMPTLSCTCGALAPNSHAIDLEELREVWIKDVGRSFDFMIPCFCDVTLSAGKEELVDFITGDSAHPLLSSVKKIVENIENEE